MAHSLSNSHASQALSNKLFEALERAWVGGGELVTTGDEFEKFRIEALKSTGEHMSPGDLDEVVKECFHFVFGSQIPSGCFITDLPGELDQSELKRVADRAVDFLAQIPASYEISFPLPQFPAFNKEITINNRVSLVPRFERATIGDAKQQGASLKVRTHGYARSGRQQSAIREATSFLKVVVRIGQLCDIFRRTPRKRVGDFFEFISDTSSEVIHSASIVSTINAGATVAIQIKLDPGLSKLLDELAVPDGLSGEESIPKLKRAQFMAEMMYAPAAQENVVSIRQALEWALDASIEEDDTMKFIKTCIGLEAILADQSQGLGITETLADRCAFLLCKTPTERKEKRKLVKDIYQLRSKIVHGKASGLKQDELKVARDARQTLSEIVGVEMRALQAWGLNQEKLAQLKSLSVPID